MNENELPEKARKLPTLNIGGDLDLKELYVRVEGTKCRRCQGSKVDPDGDYPCMLCRGKGVEKFPGGVTKTVCSEHQDKELVGVGKRRVGWEDGQGFDHNGFLEVKGCPICKVPVLSMLFG